MTSYEQALRAYGVMVPEILLPAPGIDQSKWAVVACDQFTAEPAYWERVQGLVGGAPSTYHMIFPEAYLGGDAAARITSIHRAMQMYLQQGTLVTALRGFVLVERHTSTGNRLGLMVAVDLERYDFSPGARGLIRPTEGTIVDRIPPRVRIREGAPLEATHVMLLVDDPEHRLIAPLHAQRDALRALYDVPLMQGGGRVRGWAVDRPQDLIHVAQALEALSGGGTEELLFAVGDGNHSLATARQCWLNVRGTLSPAQREAHPARFALVEIVNLHDDALAFEPIHRVVFGAEPEQLRAAWAAYAQKRALGLEYAPPAPDEQGGAFVSMHGTLPWRLSNPRDALTVATVQDFLDAFIVEHPGVEIDYIHGEDAVRTLCAKERVSGCLLPPLDKARLFPAVRERGVLPRKTFSMGEANDKRYYLECRAIL